MHRRLQFDLCRVGYQRARACSAVNTYGRETPRFKPVGLLRMKRYRGRVQHMTRAFVLLPKRGSQNCKNELVNGGLEPKLKPWSRYVLKHLFLYRWNRGKGAVSHYLLSSRTTSRLWAISGELVGKLRLITAHSCLLGSIYLLGKVFVNFWLSYEFHIFLEKLIIPRRSLQIPKNYLSFRIVILVPKQM